ncbi:peptidase [Massilia aurea]|uniref:Peptidase n=1 Tax=Massilia aurea TaxID=373040 RepID=A0A422QLL9_9BURK|nr:EcsC family protein [Massilia aurea]RNF30833.1 peptidase [Massilia aurea]
MNMNAEHLAELHEAKRLLENPGLAARISNLVGSPIEAAIERLPAPWQKKVGGATEHALQYALTGALSTLPDGGKEASYPRLHKFAASLSGGVGGVFGLPGLLVDLPLSTVIMLRSIAEIARANGERPQDVETRLECLRVLAMGGPSGGDDAADSGYFAMRIALARAVSEAAQALAAKSVNAATTPALLRLIATVAARFQVHVTQKAAAMLVPALGAVGGATINLLFVDHFQNMSRGHFAVRRLERLYGEGAVRQQYEAIVLADEPAGLLT